MNWKKLTLLSCVAVAVIALFADTAQARPGGGARGGFGGGGRGGFGGGSVQHGGRNWNGGSVQRGGRNWSGGGGHRWQHRHANRYCGGYYGGYDTDTIPMPGDTGRIMAPRQRITMMGMDMAMGAVYEGRAVDNGGGSVVTDVQQELARAGYYRGTIDGVIGTQTRNAIRAYERRNGLRVDGRIDSDLLATMGFS